MNWMQILNQAIAYMEANLKEDITVEDVARSVNVSSFYFQKGFKMMSGYTVWEYIRNRRLYEAALEVLAGGERIIDLSCRYGYESPESFTKAFTRFHGVSPMQLKREPHLIQLFQPLTIQVMVTGGDRISCRMEAMDAFTVLGLRRTFSYEHAFEEIPPVWNNFIRMSGDSGEGGCGGRLEECNVGAYGISLERDGDKVEFDYLIAGDYDGGAVPEGYETVRIPACRWAKFSCTGPLPAAIQSMNMRIYREWLPRHIEYAITAGIYIEYYTRGDIKSSGYKSEIWIPVEQADAGNINTAGSEQERTGH